MNKTRLVIIGSGPSGYTAGIYASRAKLEPLLFAGMESGGQLMYTTELENFPGFPEGVVGPKFMMSLKQQAERFGTEVIHEQITAVDFSQRPFKLWTSLPEGVRMEEFKYKRPEELKEIINQVKQQPHQVETDSVIVSTGATAILLGVPGEKEFLGKGVSTCAVCDAAFFRDKNTFVIGGGDGAMEDALALAKFAESVTVVHRRDKFRASKIMVDRVLSHPKITVIWNTNLKEVMGEKQVTKIKLEREGKEQIVEAGGVFIAIGHRPVSAIFQDELLLDGHGHVVTVQSPSQLGMELMQKRLNPKGIVSFPSMTSVEGVFAGGDIVDFRYRQAVTAAGLGAAAALDAEKWLEMQVVE